jgi:hypothetical protein
MNEKLILTDKHFLSVGTGREVYNHPFDPSKIVKISISKKFYKNQNFIENIYYKYLKKNNLPLKNIVKCFGYINTNLGKGLVFEKVCDYNGNISKTLFQVIQNAEIPKNLIVELFKELQKEIIKNKILFIDSVLSNILFCEYEKDKYKLVIIDGLGGTNIFRFYLMLFISKYKKYKLNKSNHIILNKLKNLDIFI